MCRTIVCTKCRKLTWTGCGQHKDAVLRNIPLNKRCTCNASGQNPEQRHVQSPRLASQFQSRYK